MTLLPYTSKNLRVWRVTLTSGHRAPVCGMDLHHHTAQQKEAPAMQKSMLPSPSPGRPVSFSSSSQSPRLVSACRNWEHSWRNSFPPHSVQS